MAITATIDTVNSAELQQSLRGGASRIVRTAIVKGLTSLTTSSQTALWDSLHEASLPELGDTFHPAHEFLSQYLLVHRVARGIENTKGTMARVWLHYEKPGGGGTPLERFAAEDSITLVSEPTSVFPGTAQQLLCSTAGYSPDYDGEDGTEIRPIVVNYPRTMRSLILYGLFSDQPATSVLNAANKVNSATWCGLAKGRWLCQGARVRYSSRDGMYAVSVGFLTKGDGLGEDWSSYEVPRTEDGQLAKVDESELETLYAQPYEYGVQSDKNSIWKAGLYDTAPFHTIFGTEFPIGD